MTFPEDDPAVEARVSKGVDVASGGGSEPVGGGGSGPTATMAALQMRTRQTTTNGIVIGTAMKNTSTRTGSTKERTPVTRRHEKYD